MPGGRNGKTRGGQWLDGPASREPWHRVMMMQIVTINIPDMFVDAIARLTDQGLYPSRSEAIRSALRDFLKGELEMVEALMAMSPKGDGKNASKALDYPKKIDMRSIRKGWN